MTRDQLLTALESLPQRETITDDQGTRYTGAGGGKVYVLGGRAGSRIPRSPAEAVSLAEAQR